MGALGASGITLVPWHGGLKLNSVVALENFPKPPGTSPEQPEWPAFGPRALLLEFIASLLSDTLYLLRSNMFI